VLGLSGIAMLACQHRGAVDRSSRLGDALALAGGVRAVMLVQRNRGSIWLPSGSWRSRCWW
jgi:hypothetical protein